ncbi:MAG TPA: DUF885 domain-containing protein, partial [Blastocatellia bacterium]|nr:DUF885 domain-containing protein [Blastocatellia bacterium]
SSILNPRSSILNPRSSILNPRSSILHPRSSILVLCCAFVVLPFAIARDVAAQQSAAKNEMAAADFPKLVTEYLLDLHARHPNLAAASGIHAWEAQLEDFSPLAIAYEIAAIKRFQARIEKVPPLELSLSDVVDYQILASNMKSRLLELEQIRSYERDPRIYSDVISTGLLQIAIFPYAPADSRIRHVIAKEKLIPRLLDAARYNVSKPPPIFLKVALESFKGTLSFIKDDIPKAFASVKDEKLQRAFKKSTKLAADAVADYIKHLERIRPDASVDFAIGKQHYEARLKYDEAIEIPVETLLRIAIRELTKTQDEFRRTATRIDPERDPQSVWKSLQADHPRAGALVEEAQKQLSQIVGFIREKGIVTLPEMDAPIVAATPDFMRWSTASMWTPGPFEARSLHARYLVTDVDSKWSDKQKEEYLSSFNYPQLWSTSIHEAYPGHFVQGAYLKQVASPVRKLWALAPASFVEGWAHYTEQMMLEEGFANGDPKIKMGQLADALLRLCRFVVGIRLHTEDMTVEEAKRFFIENAYMGETPSRIEAERGTFDPTYLVYSVGKLAILKLREDYKHSRGAEYSLREFHDRLLSNGNAPIRMHRQLMMPGDRGRLIE